jgi:hypothetical protein
MSRNLSHRRRVRATVSLGAVLVATGLTLAACTGDSSGAATSAQAAVNSSNAQAQVEYNEFNQAVQYPYVECDSSGACKPNPPSNPLERENLAKRLKEYNSSGDTNYVYVFTFSGTAIGYYTIEGKVSSTGSEMTSTQTVTNCGDDNSGDGGGCSVTDAIGDDGSYGPEEGGDFGVFFFTSLGTLVETDQPFLVSSTPISIYANVPQLDAPAK